MTRRPPVIRRALVVMTLSAMREAVVVMVVVGTVHNFYINKEANWRGIATFTWLTMTKDVTMLMVIWCSMTSVKALSVVFHYPERRLLTGLSVKIASF